MPKAKTKSVKPEVYVLHGWSVDPNNQEKWQPFLLALDDLEVSTHFLNIPGLSSPLDEVWNMSNFVAWLESQLPSEKPVILIGHSFGGHLAIRFAAEYPHRVAKLVLIDSSGLRDKALIPTIKRIVFWIAAKVGKLFFNIPAARTLLYKLARERDYNTAPPLLKRTMSTILDEEVHSELSKILCPTLIVWGEHDKVTPIKFAFYKKNQIKNSQLKIIKGARHSPHFTDVPATAQAVATFIKGDD